MKAYIVECFDRHPNNVTGYRLILGDIEAALASENASIDDNLACVGDELEHWAVDFGGDAYGQAYEIKWGFKAY